MAKRGRNFTFTVYVFVYAYLIFQYCSQKLKINTGAFSISVGKGNKNCCPWFTFVCAIKLKSYVIEACSQLQEPLSALLTPHWTPLICPTWTSGELTGSSSKEATRQTPTQRSDEFWLLMAPQLVSNLQSLDCSVSKDTDCKGQWFYFSLSCPTVQGSNPGRGRDFPHLSRPALGPTQLPIQWVPDLSRG